MGFCASPRLSPLVLLVLGVAIAEMAGAGAAVEDAPGGAVPGIGVGLAVCRPIDPCRGGVANGECCKAINAAIVAQGGCPCVCKVLKTYGAPLLPAACLKNSGCAKCGNCACS